MRKNKEKVVSVILTAIAFVAILLSGWMILSPSQVIATSMSKVTIICPDGHKITCEGSFVQGFESGENAKDPYCVGDGEITRCSDKTDANITDKDKKKKKDKKKDNSNTTNTSNANGNTE